MLGTRIGDGAIGGKAARLLQIGATIADRVEPARHPGLEISIPRMTKGALGDEVELEFAVALNEGGLSRVAVLQMRPMAMFTDPVDLPESHLGGANVLLSSRSALGNGERCDIADVVYLRREAFDLACAREIAREIEEINRRLVAQGRYYLLIGFGRWGTSDPWFGVPTVWPQISGARVIVEVAIAESAAGFSQGSHFLHNVTSLGVSYFSLTGEEPTPLDWQRLDRQPEETATALVRHVRLATPLTVAVDGRSKRGVVRHG